MTLTAQQTQALETMRKTINRFRRQGASETKIHKYIETWLLPYASDVREQMKNALLNPCSNRVLSSDNCPRCSGQVALTTLYGRLMLCLEGPEAGMYKVHCPQCGWRGYAPVEVARELPKRAMFARK